MKHLMLYVKFNNISVNESKTSKDYKIFYHGTTMHKGKKIIEEGLTARFYEPQWFTLADEKDGIGLSYYHAKSRNNGKTPCVIEIKLPKDKVKEYVYREGGMKKAIDAKYCRIMTNKELKEMM